MEYIFTNSAPKAIGPYSQAIKTDNMLFISGQIPIEPKTGEIIYNNIVSATNIAITNVLNIVSAAGFDKEDIVKITIYLKNMENFEKINEIYSSFFNEHKPARAVVEVSNLPKNVDIEIEAICVKNYGVTPEVKNT